jgi:hypothetical protein
MVKILYKMDSVIQITDFCKTDLPNQSTIKRLQTHQDAAQESVDDD